LWPPIGRSEPVAQCETAEASYPGICREAVERRREGTSLALAVIDLDGDTLQEAEAIREKNAA